MPKWWLTPLAGAAGGALASLIGWPLPWMVGSLLAVILLHLAAALYHAWIRRDGVFASMAGGRGGARSG